MTENILNKGIEEINSLKKAPCYLVGGYIRNRLLGEENTDADIVSDEEYLAERFADSSGYGVFSLREGFFKRVVAGGLSWDFTPLGGDIKTNLSGRDFRCDALALNIEKSALGDTGKYIIDPFCGLEDIKEKIIFPVCKSIFKADPVRIMRAFRLRSQIGFTISESLDELIQRDRRLLNSAKGERIWQEIIKSSSGDFPSSELARSGVTSVIYSMARPAREVEKIMKRVREYKKEKFLKDPVFIASLLWQDKGIAKRLKFSSKETDLFKDYISKSVNLFSCWMTGGRQAEKVFWVRYLINGKKKYLKELDVHQENLRRLKPEAFLNGKEIMRILKISPSPELGDIKKELLKAQFCGRIKTKESAAEFIKTINEK